MNVGTPVESLAAAIYTALNNPDVLPDVEHTFRQSTHKGRPSLYDVKIDHFPQTWGSTSLGFGGMGGAAMTTAYTTVIICKENAAVFFGGRHCYSVDGINDAFKEPNNEVIKRSRRKILTVS